METITKKKKPQEKNKNNPHPNSNNNHGNTQTRDLPTIAEAIGKLKSIPLLNHTLRRPDTPNPNLDSLIFGQMLDNVYKHRNL